MNTPRFSLLTKFKKAEITKLFKHASSLFSSPFFILLSAPAQLSYGRLLLVVSKKIGSAPLRNQLRRRIKTIFYENKIFEFKRDIIFIAKHKSVTQLSFNELREILVREIYKLSKKI